MSNYQAISQDLARVIGYIHADQIDEAEQKRITRETLEAFDQYVSPGWLKYRKSVSTDAAALEWRDHGAICEDRRAVLVSGCDGDRPDETVGDVSLVRIGVSPRGDAAVLK